MRVFSKIFFCIWIFLFSSSFLFSQGLTKEESDFFEQKKVLKFGYAENIMPISGVKDGQVYGVSKFLTEYFADFFNVEVLPISYRGPKELNDALLSKEIDCVFPIYLEILESERKGINITDEVLSERVMIVYKSVFKDEILKKIAVMKNSIGQIYYAQMFYPDSELVYFDSRTKYFDAVENDLANCAIGCENILQLFIRQNPEYQNLNITYLPKSEKFGIAVLEEDKILLQALNKAIAKIDSSAIVNSLIEASYIEPNVLFSFFIRKHSGYFITILLIFIGLGCLWFMKYQNKISREKQKEKRILSALNDAYLAAKNANNAKSSFLSNMSHDIRTPMNAIVGMVAIAKDNLNNQEKLADCLDKIASSSNHLLKLVNNVLDMSKIESGKLELVKEVFDLQALMLEVFEITRPIADDKNLVVKEPDFAKIKHKIVNGDRQRLSQVFINLLSNAYKYTHEHGEVAVTILETQTVSQGLKCYEITFKDSGCGMSEEFVAKLFKPFTRNENDNRITKTQGTGLGLAISKNIVQMMGGNIFVKSKENVGSTFTVTIFLEPADEKDIGEVKNSVANDEKFSLAKFKEYDFSDKKVLLVEDNEINAEIAIEILKKTGIQIEHVDNGRSAVEKVNANNKYDLIFMDIQMPIMNGYEATRQIRNLADDYAKKVPIIAMTADAFADDIARAKDAGINEHIAKPLKFELLLEILKRYLM